MVFNNLPPQAYTRDTLALAYEWLSSQPLAIKEMANNADTLVGLYLQARRRQQSGNNSGKDNSITNARPVGTANHTQVENAIKSQTTYESEGFKNDLKVLAENLKQFEDRNPFVQPNKSNENQTIANAFQNSVNHKIPDQYIIEEVIRKTAPNGQNISTHNHNSQTSAPQSNNRPHSQEYRNPVDVIGHLDVRTREILQDTCRRLNLSSEHEALRMLVVIGSDRIQGWLSQK